MDTDVNFPSDDFQALLMLLCSPTVEVIGISVCAGNTFAEESLVNLSHILAVCNATHIPIAAGKEYHHFEPRRREAEQLARDGIVPFTGMYGKGNKPRLQRSDIHHHFQSSDEPGFPTLAQLVEAVTDPIDVIALGPMTNIADAIESFPAITTKINSIWAMGANECRHEHTAPRMDFNVWFDPQSAHSVLGSGVCVNLFTYELCRANRSDQALFQRVRKRNAGLARLFAEDFQRLTNQHGVEMPLCDQLVSACYSNPEIIDGSESGHVLVQTNETHRNGFSMFRPKADGTVKRIISTNRLLLESTLFEYLDRMASVGADHEINAFLRSTIYLLDLQYS